MRLVALSLLLAGGCSDIPQDPDGTLRRIRSEQKFRVGTVARSAPASEQEIAFLQRVERAAGARASIESGAAESLLLKLEEDQLDLVLGEFHAKTPWSAQVTFVPPAEKQAGSDTKIVVSAAAKNGENAWISLLHAEAEVLGGRP